MHFHHSGFEFVACQVVNGIFKIWFKATECNIRRQDSVLGCGGAGPTEIWSESHFFPQMWFWSDFQNLLLYLFCLAVHTLISQETLELAKKMICAGSLFFFFCSSTSHYITDSIDFAMLSSFPIQFCRQNILSSFSWQKVNYNHRWKSDLVSKSGVSSSFSQASAKCYLAK